MNLFKNLSPLVVPFVSLLFAISPVSAAAPDGTGPWADSVLSSTQGLMKNGDAVPAIRSNTASALGVAEFSLTEGDFYSLGFGGNIALGFDNGVSNGAIIIESTFPGYPGELARVEMSEDGVTWVTAGNVTQDGIVNQPDSVSCAKYVRIIDVSVPGDFSDDTADGYDVDGVQATGDPCGQPTATPTPTSVPSNPGGDGLSDGRSDGGSSSPQTTTTTTTPTPTTTAVGGPSVPGFPNTGPCVSNNPLVPCLPNTGIGPDDRFITWGIVGAILSVTIIYLARRTSRFSSK